MASHSDELMRLVHDLQTMRKLPLREDYPSVSLSQLFDYIETHGPIVHPVLGEMSRFLSYEREFLPLPTDVPGRHEVVAQIHKDLSNWRKYQRIRGYIVLEQCGKTMDETIVRMPNVSFLPTDDARGLQNIWMCDGDPFAPTFVVEVNTLRWLIDPEHKVMYEYKQGGDIVHLDDTWRDLDGGNVLPGFKLRAVNLDIALDPEWVEEEIVGDRACPEPGCNEHFATLSGLMHHFDQHLDEQAMKRYLARQQRAQDTS